MHEVPEEVRVAGLDVPFQILQHLDGSGRIRDEASYVGRKAKRGIGNHSLVMKLQRPVNYRCHECGDAAVVTPKGARRGSLFDTPHSHFDSRGGVIENPLATGNPSTPLVMSAQDDFEVWSRALKQVLPEAERRMDIRPIITKLDSNNLLNFYEYAEVESTRNRIEQTRKVFQYIANKDTLYIHKFVYILETSSGFEHWARTIKENAGIPVTEVVGQSCLPQWAVRGLECSCVYGVVSGIAPVSTDSHDVAMLQGCEATVV